MPPATRTRRRSRAWAFHRAWWDAYGDNAHDQTLVVVAGRRPGDADPVAIVPLMHRHVVEPSRARPTRRCATATDVAADAGPADAKAIFFGASYHADYATILARPGRPAGRRRRRWSRTCAVDPTTHPRAVGRRRPAAAALRRSRRRTRSRRRSARARWPRAGRSTSSARTSARSSTLPERRDIDDYLATLGKKERHEIRRKVRRAEAVGEVGLDDSTDPLADLEAFIDLHQKRWGDDGLFPPTTGGDQSRVFFRRLFELFGAGRARSA